MTTTNSLIQTNKEIACRFLNLVSEGNEEAICQMITPTWKMYGGPPNLPEGPEGIYKLFEHLRTVQSQLWIIDDVFAESNKVVTRATNQCTQDSFFGIPGNGVQQVFRAMFIHYITDGKIAETWRCADDLGRIFQLGGKVVQGDPNS